MSFHKSVKKTKKTLMSKYKSTIITTSSSNNLLLSQIKDLKTTLDLNQNLLYN
jgi:ribosomal protein S17E